MAIKLKKIKKSKKGKTLNLVIAIALPKKVFEG